MEAKVASRSGTGIVVSRTGGKLHRVRGWLREQAGRAGVGASLAGTVKSFIYRLLKAESLRRTGVCGMGEAGVCAKARNYMPRA